MVRSGRSNVLDRNSGQKCNVEMRHVLMDWFVEYIRIMSVTIFIKCINSIIPTVSRLVSDQDEVQSNKLASYFSPPAVTGAWSDY